MYLSLQCIGCRHVNLYGRYIKKKAKHQKCLPSVSVFCFCFVGQVGGGQVLFQGVSCGVCFARHSMGREKKGFYFICLLSAPAATIPTPFRYLVYLSFTLYTFLHKMPLLQKGLVLASSLVALCHGDPATTPVDDATVVLTAGMLPGEEGVSASLPIHLEFLSSAGNPAWPDISAPRVLPGARLQDPPAHLRLLPTTLSNWDLAAGTEVTYSCPNEPSLIDVCDAWVFFYACPQSCVRTYQGGLAAMLTNTPGWERTQCAPRFTTGAAGTNFAHPMGSFRMQLAPGTSTSFTLRANAEFVAFGIDKDGVDCTQHLTVGACPVAGGRCKWDGASCQNNNCQGRYGPPPPCTECPWEGFVVRPSSDGPFRGLPN